MDSTIEIIRSDDTTIAFTFTDENGVAIDLTGSTVFFTVKPAVDNDLTDSSALITSEQTSHTDPTNGKTQIVLTDNDTDIDPDDYEWDVQVKDSGGLISSARRGKFKVIGDITRRTT